MRIFRRNRKDDFDIYLPQHIYHKMLAYAKVCDGEISGFGKTKVTKKKDETVSHVTVVDLRIFKQVVNGAHTSLSTDTLSKFIVSLVREGENPAEWNLWWHSHNTFGVFFSGEDDDTAEKTSNGRLYSICINKKGDLVARVDENHKNIALDIEPRVENPVQDSLMAACRAEVKKKVTVERFRASKSKFQTGTGGFYGPEGYTPAFTPTHDGDHLSSFPMNGEPHSMVPDSTFFQGGRFGLTQAELKALDWHRRTHGHHEGD